MTDTMKMRDSVTAKADPERTPRIEFTHECPRCHFKHAAKRACPRCSDTGDLDTGWSRAYNKVSGKKRVEFPDVDLTAQPRKRGPMDQLKREVKENHYD
jgi:glutaredoxin